MLLKFEDTDTRQQFVERVAAERPDIHAHVQVARRLPHLILSDLTDEQAAWVSRNLTASARAFDDVQFEPF